MCNEKLGNNSELMRHIEEKHCFICETCGDKFKSDVDRKHHKEEKHSFICETCGEKFDSDHDRKDHRETKHMIPCNNCEETFKNEKELEQHTSDNHRYRCDFDRCESVLETQLLLDSHKNREHSEFHCKVCIINFFEENLKMHVNKEHLVACKSCEMKFKKNSELEEHIETHKEYTCSVCSFITTTKDKLEEHCKAEHYFSCDMCPFIGMGEETMENHILEDHAVPDENNQFNCDECTFRTENKATYGKHFKDKHGSNTKDDNNRKDNTELGSNSLTLDEAALKEELKLLKSNFERLESMYHESLDEVQKVKAEYEAKLITAHDDYRIVKAENEVLKEKVDVLFKLGRSYINKTKTKENAKLDAPKVQDDKTEEIEIVADEEDVNLQSWSRNKLRGFKRVDPTKEPENKNTNKMRTKATVHAPSSPSPTPKVNPTPPTRNLQPPSTPAEPAGNRDEPSSNLNMNTSRRYCHYFVNQGRCNHEERTGERCRFEHKQAPMCNSGINCSRHRCMFSHPKISGNQNSRNQSFLGPMMNNPWNMINPWMNQNQNQNPWNVQSPWNLQMSATSNNSQQ